VVNGSIRPSMEVRGTVTGQREAGWPSSIDGLNRPGGSGPGRSTVRR